MAKKKKKQKAQANLPGQPIMVERVLLGLSVLLNIATWVVTIVAIPYSSDQFILHYNIYFGVDLSGPWWQLLYPSAFGTVAIAIHTYGMKPFDQAHVAMRTVSYVMMLILQILLLTGILLILPYNR